jgi:hypothetical protein
MLSKIAMIQGSFEKKKNNERSMEILLLIVP